MKQSLEKTLSICNEIEELLTNAMPQADDMRLRRIKFLANELMGFDSYITRNASRLASRAGIYFSARKHQTEQGGADGVMREMRYSLLRAIRDQAKILEHGMA
ncbi:MULTISPECIES: hypothetical protein [Comamonas]|uniref:hypothetical protein n=1 Tax=Comamonas TaxID=283 RepID=UPI000B09D33A|nr:MULTISPECIES: hypothetical protein [Comamonas]UNV89543.1 hypothetical protein MP576_18330 [Comamonas sp. 7D-2evo1]UNV97158.1 hypothetical protein MPZ60_08075 [Comamonas sp. 7D-2]UNV99188.1 hypothetical protein MP579_18335 [Comamonas sp. 7D-2evo2]